MDTMSAFAMGEANRGREPMVFDWDKAARLIRESGARNARAGLRSDWEYTGGDILRDGKPLGRDESDTYLASTWAVPELELDDGERVPCYRMASECPQMTNEDSDPGPAWDAHTFWPQSALDILLNNGKGE